MKINIPIEEEKEIRKFAKDAIEGAAKGIVRKHLEPIVIKEVGRLIADEPGMMQRLVRKAVRETALEYAYREDMRKNVQDAIVENINSYISEAKADGLLSREINRALEAEITESLRTRVGLILDKKQVSVILADPEKADT